MEYVPTACATASGAPSGDLCLEWGPDTWLPEITGADVLRSAHKLLETENPKNTTQPHGEVASRHALTPGQELRSVTFRVLVPASIIALIGKFETQTVARTKGWSQPGQERPITYVIESVECGSNAWTCPEHAPFKPKYGGSFSGVIIKTDKDVGLGTIQNTSDLATALGSENLFYQSEDDAVRFLLLSRHGTLQAAYVSSAGDLYRAGVVKTDDGGRREPVSFDLLRDRKIGVVGAGSAGSKIAMTLARSGVRSFVLVDDDIFIPQNVKRHTLTWNSVGENKADALSTQIRQVSPDANVDVRRMRLDGQECASGVAGVLDALARCDLIIDAAADANTINQLSFIAERDSKPVIWLEIYAGGLGGMIARHRPGLDPDPRAMRAAFNSYTQTATEESAPRALGAYAAEGPNGEPVIASDADVSIIAHAAAEMALDILTEQEPSKFPSSMYLIGLARGWVFDQPFHTIPIDVGLPKELPSAEASRQANDEMLAFVEDLLEKAKNDGNVTA
jgi:molybdopterin/thiamine biosynthesis adenylyltransferase